MITIDMTTASNASQSLEDWLNIGHEDLLKYISAQKHIYNVDDFIEQLHIKNTTILRDALTLASLHVTTNNNNCASIIKYGLLNLQDAIKLETNLGNYIREHGVIIDIDEKMIKYEGKSYDLSCKAIYAIPGSKEYKRNAVIRKLYDDYQINGFFCNRNSLRYGGGVCRRPEF